MNLLLALAAAASAAASAPPATGGASVPPAIGGASAPTLWGEIAYGMPAGQARSLYPAGGKVRHRPDRIAIKDYEVAADCQADVYIHHSAGSVDKVVVRGDASLMGRCSAEVLAALAQRYGAPSSQYKLDVTPVSREKTIYVWNLDSMVMRFKRYTNGALGGGGLGAASWELTYSTRADKDDVNL